MSYGDNFRTDEELAEFDHETLLKAAIFYRNDLINQIKINRKQKERNKELGRAIDDVQRRNGKLKRKNIELKRNVRKPADYIAISDKARAMIIKEKAKNK